MPEQVAVLAERGLKLETKPKILAGASSAYPTRDEQFYRISGTTSGAAIMGGAIASTLGAAVIPFAAAGAFAGFALSILAASHAKSHEG